MRVRTRRKLPKEYNHSILTTGDGFPVGVTVGLRMAATIGELDGEPVEIGIVVGFGDGDSVRIKLHESFMAVMLVHSDALLQQLSIPGAMVVPEPTA